MIFSRIRLRLTGEDETETKYMQWYTYFLLLIVYVIYLAFGAVVFQAIEQPAEVSEFKSKQLYFELIFRLQNVTKPNLNSRIK